MSKPGCGMVHIYTGNGKGKTTAAIGLGIRSAGAGRKVCLYSFLKNRSSEHILLEKLRPQFDFYISNLRPRGFLWKITAQERQEAVDDAILAWESAQSQIASRACDMLILDEIMALIKYEILPVEELIRAMGMCKSAGIELVLTGRNAPPELIATADLVTEMLEIKHPLADGVKARLGIEY